MTAARTHWQLCDFFEVGGHLLLDDEHLELEVLRLRPRLLALGIPFAYETRDEYASRKRKLDGWRPVLRLWRPLSVGEIKQLRC